MATIPNLMNGYYIIPSGSVTSTSGSITIANWSGIQLDLPTRKKDSKAEKLARKYKGKRFRYIKFSGCFIIGWNSAYDQVLISCRGNAEGRIKSRNELDDYFDDTPSKDRFAMFTKDFEATWAEYERYPELCGNCNHPAYLGAGCGAQFAECTGCKHPRPINK